jgi:hypothetical protein
MFKVAIHFRFMVPSYSPQCESNILQLSRYQVLTAASTKMSIFWDVAPCSVVEILKTVIFE